MAKVTNFTEGKVLGPLIKFAFPVFLALLLQSLYGAVDLMVVGHFGTSADVSAVSTGSQLLASVTNFIASFAMGTTVVLGQKIGEGKQEEGGSVIGASIAFFAVFGLILTILLVIFAPQLTSMLQAPEEAYASTVSYVRICGTGLLVIISYNLLACIFRGIGDSTTPLIAVMIACISNIGGDLLLVAGFKMGAAGAAIATVAAQALSVLLSLWLISRKELPFAFAIKRDVRFNGPVIARVTGLGFPIALQDALVSISFLIILGIVNSLGLTASAGMGVAEKVCGFIMLVPSAFSQSMSAFTAQNYGARRMDRAEEGLRYAIGLSFIIGLLMFYVSFFHGDLLTAIFSNDPAVIAAGWDYLKAYAIDCTLTPIVFCFIGFYNGVGRTTFVMFQGIFTAFLIRIPVSYFMSKQVPPSLFHIGLGIPASSLVSIIMCLVLIARIRKNWSKG